MKKKAPRFEMPASVFAAIWIATHPLTAQTEKVISSADACTTCIEMSHVFTLGGGGEDEIAGAVRAMVRDSR